jgi:UDP-N-acetylmuramyl pentapeptide phosphotransferase/UDP-N-acetylglucosamine-1-phosphate transferase
MLQLSAAFGFTFLLVILKTPAIIKISRLNDFYDNHESHRKKIREKTSRLGGLAMISSMLLGMYIFNDLHQLNISALMTALIILAVLGLKDDLSGGGVQVRYKFVV